MEILRTSCLSAIAGTSVLWCPHRATCVVLLWEEMQMYGWRERWSCISGVSPDADSLHRDCSVHCRDCPSHGREAARLPAQAAAVWSMLPLYCRLSPRSLLWHQCWGRIMHQWLWLWASTKLSGWFQMLKSLRNNKTFTKGVHFFCFLQPCSKHSLLQLWNSKVCGCS